MMGSRLSGAASAVLGVAGHFVTPARTPRNSAPALACQARRPSSSEGPYVNRGGSSPCILASKQRGAYCANDEVDGNLLFAWRHSNRAYSMRRLA